MLQKTKTPIIAAATISILITTSLLSGCGKNTTTPTPSTPSTPNVNPTSETPPAKVPATKAKIINATPKSITLGTLTEKKPQVNATALGTGTITIGASCVKGQTFQWSLTATPNTQKGHVGANTPFEISIDQTCSDYNSGGIELLTPVKNVKATLNPVAGTVVKPTISWSENAVKPLHLTTLTAENTSAHLGALPAGTGALRLSLSCDKPEGGVELQAAILQPEFSGDQPQESTNQLPCPPEGTKTFLALPGSSYIKDEKFNLIPANATNPHLDIEYISSDGITAQIEKNK